MKASKIL